MLFSSDCFHTRCTRRHSYTRASLRISTFQLKPFGRQTLFTFVKKTCQSWDSIPQPLDFKTRSLLDSQQRPSNQALLQSCHVIGLTPNPLRFLSPFTVWDPYIGWPVGLFPPLCFSQVIGIQTCTESRFRFMSQPLPLWGGFIFLVILDWIHCLF